MLNKTRVLLGLNFMALLSLVFAIGLIRENALLFIIVMAVNLLLSYKFFKLYKLIKLGSKPINSLESKKIDYITYGSMILFFLIYIYSIYLKSYNILVNSYIFYLGFYFFSVFMINFYEKENFVIRGEIINLNVVKNISVKTIKHSAKLEITLNFINGKNTKFEVEDKEFSDMKKIMKLNGKIKY